MESLVYYAVQDVDTTKYLNNDTSFKYGLKEVKIFSSKNKASEFIQTQKDKKCIVKGVKIVDLGEM